MPVATPKRDRQIIKPCMPNIMKRRAGGSSDAGPDILASRNAKKAREQHKRMITLPKIATIAATVTEAERFGEDSIKCWYITSTDDPEGSGESNAKEKRSLTFAFFSPKVPVEI